MQNNISEYSAGNFIVKRYRHRTSLFVIDFVYTILVDFTTVWKCLSRIYLVKPLRHWQLATISSVLYHSRAMFSGCNRHSNPACTVTVDLQCSICITAQSKPTGYKHYNREIIIHANDIDVSNNRKCHRFQSYTQQFVSFCGSSFRIRNDSSIDVIVMDLISLLLTWINFNPSMDK